MATDKLVDFDHVTDYISREAAISIIMEACAECMDACAEFDGLVPDCDECMMNGAKKKLATITAADVRPVVLCRDCKHFNPYPGDCTDGCIEGVCKRHNSIGVLVMDEDFCSDAERI